jgi:hypothetical protein
MYFWNTNQLASEIKSDQLSQSNKKSYYLVTSIIMTVSMYLVILGAESYTFESALIEAILQVIIVVIGINLTFNANGADSGQDYIERMVLLSLPILVKVLLLSFLVGFVFGIVFAATGNEGAMEWPMVILSLSVHIFFFWRLKVHLEGINT